MFTRPHYFLALLTCSTISTFSFVSEVWSEQLAEKELPKSNIMVVDVGRVIEGLTAYKGVMKEMEVRNAEYRREASKTEAALKERSSKLEKERQANEISNEQAHEAMAAISEEASNFHKKNNNSRAVMENAYGAAMQQIGDGVLQSVEATAKERNVDVAVEKNAILYAKDGLDATTEVQALVNSTLPSVKVDFDAAAKKIQAVSSAATKTATTDKVVGDSKKNKTPAKKKTETAG